MNKFKQTLYELHLYKGKIEYLIKFLIWVACWIIGICVARSNADNIGSAYFVFALALLMEFAFQIKEKKALVSRIFHTLFCFAMVAILIISVLSIFLSQYNETYDSIMFPLSICLMVYMAIDCLILWIGRDEEDKDALENNSSADELAKILLEKFNENLNGGNLGNLKNKR